MRKESAYEGSREREGKKKEKAQQERKVRGRQVGNEKRCGIKWKKHLEGLGEQASNAIRNSEERGQSCQIRTLRRRSRREEDETQGKERHD